MKTDLAGQLRSLPSVDEVVSRLEGRYPRRLLVDEVRRVIAGLRDEIRAGHGGSGDVAVDDLVVEALEWLGSDSLVPVINATGVVLHTNLGRAPLMPLAQVPGYSNLEYDIAAGRRGKRDTHTAVLLERLLDRSAIVVNNNAAAVYLTLNELACGGEVLISRGELIEIGDGFRIPDIMARSGAVLREVGTTNRTHIDDYRAGLSERTRLILRVHPSNFHVSGFTSKPALKELAELARERCIPLYEDLGSGCIAPLPGIHEPLVSESLAAGVNVVTFSGDKLLGGPQAGIIAGDRGLVARIRRNPMFRALRVDKLIVHALEQTLRALVWERYDDIPALRMLRLSADEIRERAERLSGGRWKVVAGESVAGGGSTPDQSLPTWLLEVQGDALAIERALRLGLPPVIARIVDDRVVIDLRTVLPEQEAALAAALEKCLS
jgi:L-seryl-tRNA(Ser) seleniumtransferase